MGLQKVSSPGTGPEWTGLDPFVLLKQGLGGTGMRIRYQSCCARHFNSRSSGHHDKTRILCLTGTVAWDWRLL